MKVYISSTYLDLVEHRAAVDRTLRRMGHDVIGMEQYVAEGSKPVDRCKADVRTADAYVIIVAWRYGHARRCSIAGSANAGPTVALVVDRDVFALELAREWVRSGLPRSPVR